MSSNTDNDAQRSKFKDACNLIVESFRNSLVQYTPGKLDNRHLETIKIEELKKNLRDLANIKFLNPSVAEIHTLNKSQLTIIENTLRRHGIGQIRPITNGLEITVPSVTAEDIQNKFKQLKLLGNSKQVLLRNQRHDYLQWMKKQKFSENDSKRFEKEITNLVTDYCDQIETLYDNHTKPYKQYLK